MRAMKRGSLRKPAKRGSSFKKVSRVSRARKARSSASSAGSTSPNAGARPPASWVPRSVSAPGSATDSGSRAPPRAGRCAQGKSPARRWRASCRPARPHAAARQWPARAADRPREAAPGAVGEPEIGRDIERAIQARAGFVAPARCKQVSRLERIEHGRHRIEFTRRAHVRKTFIGPVLRQQQRRQAEVRRGHVRIDRQRTAEFAFGSRPIEVEPIELEGLLRHGLRPGSGRWRARVARQCRPARTLPRARASAPNKVRRWVSAKPHPGQGITRVDRPAPGCTGPCSCAGHRRACPGRSRAAAR